MRPLNEVTTLVHRRQKKHYVYDTTPEFVEDKLGIPKCLIIGLLSQRFHARSVWKCWLKKLCFGMRKR